MLHSAALLAADQSRSADKTAIEGGMPGVALMERAGRAVVDVVCQHFRPCMALVVCGVGNNGGDGFIAARILKERGWTVMLAVAGNADAITGDAKRAKDKWNMAGGASRTFSPGLLRDCGVIVDAIFGTGLSRNVEGAALDAINAINAAHLPVVSVDIASGIDADTGHVMGGAIRARHTVTFVRPKPGHVLLPGKAHTGELHVYDIGISGEGIAPSQYLNLPELWKSAFPFPAPEANKYTRGHAVVIGGGINMTGASRLAAISALRAGAGLVSVACSPEALPVYASSLLAVMTKPAADLKQLKELLEDKRITTVLIGPGCGVDEATRERALYILSLKKPCVIDADAISAFAENPKQLFSALHASAVLTPHEGEFTRLFKSEGTKSQRAADAARQSGAVILFKGNDTVIAAPGGRVAINANAPPWLATAGSGDVLAGIITGLLAQGMPAFEAACAGAWMHGEAATGFGPGLIAEDIPAALPAVFRKLYG
ncbi:MAG: NAD(P)H-hydrate dehydratase [Pseudomonadota bacterium]|nr:NAD(P)H-hydrate dehydratase [Pseudomonadota bacterium]MDE3037925.1 NAD(P)H-hydrate dehydratase [Pseudomonadota bacterium]